MRTYNEIKEMYDKVAKHYGYYKAIHEMGTASDKEEANYLESFLILAALDWVLHTGNKVLDEYLDEFEKYEKKEVKKE